MIVSICDTAIEWTGPRAPSGLRDFEVKQGAGECSLQISSHAVERLPHMPEPDYTIGEITRIKREDGRFIAWNDYPGLSDATAYLELEGERADIQVGPNTIEGSILNMLMLGLLPVVAKRSGLLIHASLVRYQGRAVAFSAASGTGKSAHADLWCHHLGAEMMNGDRAFLRRREDGWWAFGSPWAGSSPYVINVEAPLAAVVMLKQAPENRMRRLSGVEIVQRLYNNVRYPLWDEESTSLTLETLDMMTGEVPIYELECLPDEAAARLACKIVFDGC